MPAIAIESEDQPRYGAGEPRTAPSRGADTPNPDAKVHSHLEQRRRRRAQKKQIIERVQRILGTEPLSDRAP